MNKFYAFVITLFLFSACGHSEKGHYTLYDSLDERSVENASQAFSTEELLEGVELIEIHEGAHNFLIPDREGQIRKNPL